MVFATAGRGNVRGNDHPNAHVAKRCRGFPDAIMIANLAGVFARGSASERALMDERVFSASGSASPTFPYA